MAIKSDLVEGLFRVVGSAGLKLQLVDVSVASLCNAFRFNYADLDGCSMVLDIGAKTSNVLFFEKNKYSCRTINIGANSITQDFANEAKMPFMKAEQFKIAEGFVSLGGAYEEPENPQQAQVAKVARQVMTRLHIQVNQSIQFYRGQQGGAAPVRLFLSGGASIMPYTLQFFAEKLNMPVEYLNPLRNIQIDPSVNLEELAKVAHSFGEAVGLGLRNLAQCPIELNLMPKTILNRQQFNQKKPYFVATAASLVLALISIGWFYNAKVVAAKKDLASQLDQKAAPLKQIWDGSLDKEIQQLESLKQESTQVTGWLSGRTHWVNILVELRLALQYTEKQVERLPDLESRKVKAGVWIRKMVPEVPGEGDEAAGPVGAPRIVSSMTPEMMKRYGMVPQVAATPEAAKNTNEVVTVNLTCTAVNLKRFSDSANQTLMGVFKAQLLSKTNLFAPDTDLGKTFTPPADSDDTFNFDVVIKLKSPIKL